MLMADNHQYVDTIDTAFDYPNDYFYVISSHKEWGQEVYPKRLYQIMILHCEKTNNTLFMNIWHEQIKICIQSSFQVFIRREIGHWKSTGNTKTSRVKQARTGSNKDQYFHVKCVTVFSLTKLLMIVSAGCGRLLKEFSKILKTGFFSNTFWHARAGVLVTLLLKAEVLRVLAPYRLVNACLTTWSCNPDLCYLDARVTVREVNWAALSVFADEPAVQGVRGASGRLPFWRLHVRGMQGEIAGRQLEMWDCALGQSQDLFQVGGKQRTEMFVKEALTLSKPSGY